MSSRAVANYVASFDTSAHIVTSDREALAIARKLVSGFASGASDRDRDQRLPFAEIEIYSESGLWGITIPREHGGAGFGGHGVLGRRPGEWHRLEDCAR